MKKLRIGLIGCGNIGTELVKAINSGVLEAEVVVVFDQIIERAQRLAEMLRWSRSKIAKSIDEFLGMPMDIAVEAASQEAVRNYVPKILEKGISVVIMSVGALLDTNFLLELQRIAEKSGAKIYIPSGAIGGIDAIKAASIVGIDELVLVTRKPPKALKGAPGVRGIDLDKLEEPVTVFEGSGEEAIRLFPANINVVATLSLASERSVKVKIVADPAIDRNIHEIHARGPFGEIILRFSNAPSPLNPRTSYIAILSLIRLLKQIESTIIIGT